MRVIKFRAFNKNDNIMVCSNEDDSCGYWDGVNLSIVDMVNSQLKYNMYEWMQYTELKDKNEKEIFEGDIVKGSAYEKEIYTGVVEFYDASFIMKIDGSKGYYRLNKMTFQTLEVIGNIYENKELLND